MWNGSSDSIGASAALETGYSTRGNASPLVQEGDGVMLVTAEREALSKPNDKLRVAVFIFAFLGLMM